MQKICKKYAKYASNMQVFMILLNIACNMQNMQNNMHDLQNMQTSFPICRICTAHFADDGPTRLNHARTQAGTMTTARPGYSAGPASRQA
jgi:hypothetical protein